MCAPRATKGSIPDTTHAIFAPHSIGKHERMNDIVMGLRNRPTAHTLRGCWALSWPPRRPLEDSLRHVPHARRTP
eukprot:1260527-Pyramimonas_sp.AAC.1